MDGVTEVAVLADYAEHVRDIEKSIEEARVKAEKLSKERKTLRTWILSTLKQSLSALNKVKIADKRRTKKYK